MKLRKNLEKKLRNCGATINRVNYYNVNDREYSEMQCEMYKLYSEKFVDFLDGMFAIAILDHRKQSFVLYRDPYGIKPIYWSLNRGDFAFSSDLSNAGSQLYKPSDSLHVGAGTSVNITSDEESGNLAFTRANEMTVATGATFTVGAGTTLTFNVLGVF